MLRRARACAVLFAVLLPAVSEAAAQLESPPISYVVTAETDGNPGGEWIVDQGPELTVARWSDESGPGDVALVAGPAVGGAPAEPTDDMGGLLGILFDPGAEVGPGYRKESSYGSGTAVVDSVRLELREGAADETIAGHEGRLHVMTARVWWRHQAEDASVTAVVDTGTADLWFAPDLPFSWIPLAVHPSRPALALPLSFGWPELAQVAALRFESRFRELGLLLRARTRDESRPGQNPAAGVELVGNDLRASVELADVRTIEAAPDPGPFRGLPRLPRSRVLALQLVGFLLDPCRSLASGSGGSAELSIDGAWTHRSEGGSARVVTEAPAEESYAVVAGSMGAEGGACTLLLLPGTGPRAGAFPIAAPNPGAGDEDGTIAIHVSAEGPESRRLVVLERGEVRIEKAGADEVTGRVEGAGWGLASNPGVPAEVLEELELTLSFVAMPASP
jgi:hypothetical protein